MSDITATSLNVHLSANIQALKLSLEQDNAAISIVEKALATGEQDSGPTSSSDRLVDIVV
jgi:hypothetical protein